MLRIFLLRKPSMEILQFFCAAKHGLVQQIKYKNTHETWQFTWQIMKLLQKSYLALWYFFSANMYPNVTSARSCNKVGHLFWFTILAQCETNDIILFIHSVHKHRGNSFQCQNYKMRLKQKFELNKFHASKKDPFY